MSYHRMCIIRKYGKLISFSWPLSTFTYIEQKLSQRFAQDNAIGLKFRCRGNCSEGSGFEIFLLGDLVPGN